MFSWHENFNTSMNCTILLETECTDLDNEDRRLHAMLFKFIWALVMQVASILNFSLMYLLAPTLSVGNAAPAGFIASIFSDRILKAWGAPGCLPPWSKPLDRTILQSYFKHVVILDILLMRSLLITDQIGSLREGTVLLLQVCFKTAPTL